MQKPRCSLKPFHRATGILSLYEFTGNSSVPRGIPWMHTGALAVPDRLATRTLISQLEDAETPGFVLAEHLVERFGRTDRADDLVGAGVSGLVADQVGSGQADLSTAQAIGPPGSLSTAQATKPSGRLVTDQAPVSVELNDVGWNIVGFCEVPRFMAAIMGELGLTHRTFFRRDHLEPLLAGGLLGMTHPDQPNHPHQA